MSEQHNNYRLGVYKSESLIDKYEHYRYIEHYHCTHLIRTYMDTVALIHVIRGFACHLVCLMSILDRHNGENSEWASLGHPTEYNL